MARRRDEAWEALVRETRANPEIERGSLNTALRAIKAAAEVEGLLPDDLPAEISLRAAAYRKTFPGMTLTPNALAKHWFRVVAETDDRSPTQRKLDELRRRDDS
jgi:hypothetical protein